MFKHFYAAVLALAFSIPTAQAHHTWLETNQGENSSVLRFGEYHFNRREVSPGYLDGFTATHVTLHSTAGTQDFTSQTTTNGLVIPVAPQAGESLTAQDDRYPLHTWKQNGQATTGWFHFAARLIVDEAVQLPTLPLDITPTGTLPGHYQLSFQGQPLPQTKVQALTASGWIKEAYTNADGLVQFDLPWRGQYVFHAMHLVPEKGERDGENYDVIGYVTTLTWVKPEGLTALEALPPRDVAQPVKAAEQP